MTDPMQVEGTNSSDNRSGGKGRGGKGGRGRRNGNGGGRGRGGGNRGRGGRGGGGGSRGRGRGRGGRGEGGSGRGGPRRDNEGNNESTNGGPITNHPVSDEEGHKRRATSETNGTSGKRTKLGHITEHKFSELEISAPSRRALAEVFKYECMTVVQSETLPVIMQGDDCLAKAKTGTGKTLAFMIPTIERMLANHHDKNYFSDSNQVSCLVLSPTRELAQQISTETEKLLTFHPSEMQKVVTCVGGTNMNQDLRRLKGKTPFVVATPGRLLDHLQNKGLAKRMTQLDALIFDEADQLLDMGFRPDIERILRLLQPSQATRQTLLFSATVPATVSEIARVALRPKYHYIDTVGNDTEQTHLHVKQELIVTCQEQQLKALFSILNRETSEKPYKIIVFFTTARLTGFMSELFNSVSQQSGYKVLEIHSRKSQKQRERASEQFRSSKNAIMFSSDVSARGMDYPDVTFVLQIGLTDRAQYIHRLGRTARAGKDGKGALLLADYEQTFMVKRELADMPLETLSLDLNAPSVENVWQQAMINVTKESDLKLSAEQAYRAWLGYYNGHLRKIKWDKTQLVKQANLWATEQGLKKLPSLQKRTIGKMGLRGVSGLVIEN